MFLPYSPVWSIVMIAFDAFLIRALLAPRRVAGQVLPPRPPGPAPLAQLALVPRLPSRVGVAVPHASPTGRGAAEFWAGLLLLLMVVVILRQVLAAPVVTVQSIYGAISAYLIIGLMFAAFYAAMHDLGGGHFFANNEHGSTANFQYFSFTTLTTLRYGDFTAAENGGRAVAMLEAMTGQIFLATLVAKLVSSFRTSPVAPPPT